MGWVWVIVIVIILTAIAIIIAIVIFSGSNNNKPRPPNVDSNKNRDTGGGGSTGGDTGGGSNGNGTGGTGGTGNGTNSPPITPGSGEPGSACTINSDCASNTCSSGYCQVAGVVTGTIGSTCVVSNTGPQCNSGLYCDNLGIGNSIGICKQANGKYGQTCDNLNQRCITPYVCASSGVCQFNIPTNACASNTCAKGFTCVSNNCVAGTLGLCFVNGNCLLQQCNATPYCSEWIIDASNQNYQTWMGMLNPIPNITAPATIGRLEVSSDRTEAWLYIDIVNKKPFYDVANSIRSVQYWNASVGKWTLALNWLYNNIYTYNNGDVLQGYLSGITMAPSNKCYAIMHALRASKSIQYVIGICIFEIVPQIDGKTVTFSLKPYNTDQDGVPGLQLLEGNVVFSNISSQYVSSTTYNNADYMVIRSAVTGSSDIIPGVYTRDINNLSSPYYIPTNYVISNANALISNTNIQPSYYFSPFSTNPLVDFTTVNYGIDGGKVSLTYYGTISSTITPPSTNNTVNQFSNYRHYQIDGKPALAMIYRSLGSDATPQAATLAINYDVTKGSQAESFPGYIPSDDNGLAPNVQGIYVVSRSRCN